MLRRPKQYHISASFDTVPEKPDGFLLVELDASEVGVEDAVEVILDASGSMYQKLDGRFRYQIAGVKAPGSKEADRPKIVIRSAKTTAIQLKP